MTRKYWTSNLKSTRFCIFEKKTEFFELRYRCPKTFTTYLLMRSMVCLYVSRNCHPISPISRFGQSWLSFSIGFYETNPKDLLSQDFRNMPENQIRTLIRFSNALYQKSFDTILGNDLFTTFSSARRDFTLTNSLKSSLTSQTCCDLMCSLSQN
jgi:hypothetical protein